MQLSIFPKSKALPTKEEKAKQARFTSKPFLPQIVEVKTDEELIEVICNNAWSPSIFTEHRSQANFISTDFMVLDIDEGMRIDEAEQVVHSLDICCLALPSTSHTEENHRFRLVFPLSKTISSKDTFEATMSKLAQHFPADPSCIGDSGRFFFGGKLVAGFFYESKLLEPSVSHKPKNQPKLAYDSRDSVVVGESIEELTEALYGEKRTKVPDSIAYFLENAPDNLDGEWYIRSNSFLFTCGLLNLNQDKVKEVFFSLYPHEELTEKKVDRMILDGYNSREEEL